MHRTLFDIGSVSIHLYGVMLAIAFWLGIELSTRLAKKRGLDGTSIIDLGIIVLVASVVGARLLYVITHAAEYQHDLVGVFRVWEGGLTFYGGFAAGVIAGVGFLKRQGLPILGVTDIVAPQIALGISLARIGCFLNGCCFGIESDLPWACTFPQDSQAGWVMAGAAVHPTQLYSAIANFIIFVILLKLLKRGFGRGIVFFTFLVMYGVWRFAIDYLRYYEDNVRLRIASASVTWYQVASAGVAVVGVILLLRARHHGKRDEAG